MPNSLTTARELFVAYSQTFCQYLARAADGVLEPIDPQPTVYRAQYISPNERTPPYISSIRLTLAQDPPIRLLCLLHLQQGAYQNARYFKLASGGLTEEKYRQSPTRVGRILAHQYFVVTGDDNPWDDDFRNNRKGYFVTPNSILAVRSADQDAFKSPIFTLGEETDEVPKKTIEEVDLDPVTKIPSRKQYDHDLPTVSTMAIQSSLPLALMVIDVDDFKSVNAKAGHTGGDEALRAVGQAIQGCLHGKGTVYRYGGDEFVALLPNHALAEAQSSANRIRAEVESIKHSAELKLTVTIGVSGFPKPIDRPEELFQAADRMLMLAKERGEKNQVHTDIG